MTQDTSHHDAGDQLADQVLAGDQVEGEWARAARVARPKLAEGPPILGVLSDGSRQPGFDFMREGFRAKGRGPYG